MTQLIEVIELTFEQSETCIKNICKVRNMGEPEIIFDGKPVFSQETIQKYNLPKITKYSKRYVIYKSEPLKYEGEVPESIKCVNADKTNIYIVVFTDKFDKLNLSAIIGLYHKFQDLIDLEADPPVVNICAAFVVTNSMQTHVPKDIIPCNYRFYSLSNLYPIIGSKRKIFGLTYDYKVFPFEKTYNDKKYIDILDGDPMVKILNAKKGQLIFCKRVILDTAVYGDVQIRKVKSSITNINVIDPSGICLNFKK